MRGIAASPYQVPKSVGVKGDFWHTWSSEQHATVAFARYDFHNGDIKSRCNRSRCPAISR